MSVVAQADGPAPGMAPGGALYRARVLHARRGAIRHRFDYRIFTLLLDIDRIADTLGGLRVLRHGRFGLMSFTERDHGPRDGSALRPWVETALTAAGLPGTPARIDLLAMPRVLGFLFNPLSIYFCHADDGALYATVYQVHNTFGRAHAYVLAAGGADDGAVSRQTTAKAFHVSPFLGMDGRYRFRIAAPGDHLGVFIDTDGLDGAPWLLASMTGQREALSDSALLRAWASHPLLTLKVVAAIHWQAVRLLAKGARYHPDPHGSPTPAPPQPDERKPAG